MSKRCKKGTISINRKCISANKIRDGEFIREYPIDESWSVSNAGKVEIYKYNGKRYAIMTWNREAIEHKDGEIEIHKVK